MPNIAKYVDGYETYRCSAILFCICFCEIDISGPKAQKRLFEAVY